jgi:tripartite-type tricarboxylate transporter receptor subunit TctC
VKPVYIVFTALVFFCSFLARADAAENYPVKPVNFIVPIEAGADADVLARPLAIKVSTLLGKPLIVVNKPGAASAIGLREIYAAKPDGYTIGIGWAVLIINKLQGILPFDHNDVTVLGTYATYTPIIVVSSKTNFKTIQEMMAFAKSHPGELSLATTAVGGSFWVAAEAFQAMSGLKFNIIPQPGGGAFSIAQAAGGHADLAVMAMGAAKPMIDAGNVRFVATFGSKRAPGYENVPSLKDVGLNVNWESTQIVIGPPKMPRDVTEKLVKVFREGAADPEFHKFVTERNAVPFYLPPEKAVAFFNEQRGVCRAVMEKAGILKEK